MDVIAGLEKAKPAMEYLRDAGVGCGVRITIGELQPVSDVVHNRGYRKYGAEKICCLPAHRRQMTGRP